MKFSKEVKVGVFMVISIATLYLGFNYLKGIDFLSSSMVYYVVYDDVLGLQVSNSVSVNGFSVGRVSNISLMQERGNKVLVELDVQQDIELNDSTVAFLDVGLLGNVSIILEVGESETKIQPGDTLQARLNKALVDLLKESALPVADNLQITIRRINTILDGLSGNTARISEILENLADVSGNVKRLTSLQNRKMISGILDQLNQTSEVMKSTIDKVGPMLDNYNAVADSLKSLDMKSTISKVNQTFDNLNKTLTKFNESEGTLSKLIENDSLYNNLNRMIEDFDKLLIHMNENPKDFFAPLGKSKKKIDRRKKSGN